MALIKRCEHGEPAGMRCPACQRSLERKAALCDEMAKASTNLLRELGRTGPAFDLVMRLHWKTQVESILEKYDKLKGGQ